MGGTASYSGYYEQPGASGFPAGAAIPQSSMGYHQSTTDYGQDARQTQSFASAYNPTGMMYNVQQPTAQTPVYDASSQFSSRQPAAMQMLATDVTTPYFQGEPANAAAASALQPQAGSSSAASAVYQQSPADRSNMLQGYQGSMAQMTGLATQTQSSGGEGASIEEPEYPAAGGLDEAYASYQTALKEVFQNVRTGAVSTAGASLLSISDWLLSHVTELGKSPTVIDRHKFRDRWLTSMALPGLASDDQNLHGDRLKLWNDFNHAWLAMLQKQKDQMESEQRSQLISRDDLEKMGKELVRLCDSIERHGLVDYEYGVWEEQIIGSQFSLGPHF
jgi:hypothetical protein